LPDIKTGTMRDETIPDKREGIAVNLISVRILLSVIIRHSNMESKFFHI
jgi:hypothetical protein